MLAAQDIFLAHRSRNYMSLRGWTLPSKKLCCHGARGDFCIKQKTKMGMELKKNEKGRNIDQNKVSMYSEIENCMNKKFFSAKTEKNVKMSRRSVLPEKKGKER